MIIQAPVSQVWETLCDFSSYEKWSKFIKQVQGLPVVGTTLKVCIHPPKASKQTFYPIVIQADLHRHFAWRGALWGMPWLFCGEHHFKLKHLGDATELVHSEKFSGCLVPLIWKFLETKTKAGFEHFNQALKTQCESHDPAIRT